MEAVKLAGGAVVTGGLPLYANATPLQAERHARAAISGEDKAFEFAQATPTVPLTVDEFERAALDYPILFFGPQRRAIALTGLTPGANLFVTNDGTYARGRYIPAYLRRHPFVLARDTDADRWIVCVDEQSPRLVDRDAPDSLPLFEADGTPTALTRDAIAFCREYEQAEQRTEQFVQLVDELELFEPRQAHYAPAARDGDGDGAADPVLLLDYLLVSRDKLDALTPEQLLRLRDTDALAPIYAHLVSAANWDVLALRDAD